MTIGVVFVANSNETVPEGRTPQDYLEELVWKGVERRYQLNMVLVLTEEDKKLYQRYKITLNRSKIINIELIYSKK